ncbi:MAG: ATP-binding protein [Alphaproteobacteria bacterium]|nr:ATP-binding protein [Alphaproteobacteria bacterium]
MAITTMDIDRSIPKPSSRKKNAAARSRGLTNQLLWLTGLLVFSLGLTVVSLFWSAYSQDKIAAANARHLAGTALKVQMSILKKITTDYTWWDEAYQKTSENFDPDWFDANFADAEYFSDTFGITGSFIVGPDDKILRHMRDSELVEDAPRLDTAVYFNGGVNDLIRTARQPLDGNFVAASGFVTLDGRFYFVAARVIHPHSDELFAKAAVTPANAFVAAVMRPLDGPLLQTLARDFGLRGLRYVAADDAAGKLPLAAANGDGFGALTWQVDRPSQYVMKVVLPGFLAVIVSIGLLGWYVLNSLRRGQSRLLQSMQEAQMADRSKTEFLANMSHELRTPLNAIIGFSEMMKDETFGPLGNEHYGEYSSLIHYSGEHLLDIINDVLELSKVEAGKFVLQETEVALPIVVESAVRLIEPRAEEKYIALDIDVAPDLPTIIADDRALKQILLNLLSNAVKFTPPAGAVGVRVACNVDGGVEMTVSDTGCGIPDDQLALVMRPFHQVEGARTRSESGTGLGLPLSASLVALHGGDVRIDSKIDRGTTVSVTLPKTRVATAQAA